MFRITAFAGLNVRTSVHVPFPEVLIGLIYENKNQNQTILRTCLRLLGRSAGAQFVIFNPRFQPFGTACVECEAKPMPDYVGKFARSVESGWLGKVIAIEGINGDTMLKMQGVNELYRTLKGGHIDDAIEAEDVQWFTPEDLKFLKRV